MITIDWQEELWSFDEDDLTMQQALVIKHETRDEQFPGGRGITAWQLGVKNGDPLCVRAAVWLMKQQAGERVGIAAAVRDDFPLGSWHEAWKKATVASITDPGPLRAAIGECEKYLDQLRRALEVAEAAAQPDDAADEEGPTSRPGARSRTSGSPKADSPRAASSPSGGH